MTINLTTKLKEQMRDNIKAALEVIMTYGAVGEGATTTAAADTELELEFFRSAIAEFDDSVTDTVTASLRLSANEGNNNAAAEVGWYDTASFSIDNCDTADWTDDAEITTTLNTSEYKENDIALNLIKDTGSSATTATYKTTTSVNFTSKSLSVWLYIVDAAALAKLATSNCLIIRFGSDSSNYYQWAKDAADLAVGWNLVKGLTSANADSTTGTPTLTACDYTYISLVATGTAIVWIAGDFIMDDIKLTSGNFWTHNLINSKNKTDDIQLYLDTSIKITITEA